MKWYKITLKLSDITSQRVLNSRFLEIYEENKNPENLKLFQAEPDFYIDYFILTEGINESKVSEIIRNFNATEVIQPITSKLHLMIGKRNNYINIYHH